MKISQHDEVFIGIEEIFAGGASEQNSSLFLFGVIALHHILVVLSFKRLNSPRLKHCVESPVPFTNDR